MATLRIKQVKSGVGYRSSHRATLQTLGLRRIGQVVERADSLSVRGLIRTVRHLVTFEEVAEPEEKKPARRRSTAGSTTTARRSSRKKAS